VHNLNNPARREALKLVSTLKHNTPLATTPQLMSEQEAAIRMDTSNIVDRFSTSDKYNAAEQEVINHAIEILASKLVNQDPANHLTSTELTRQFLQLKIGTSEREIFAVIFMNNQHRVIAYEEMFVGTSDAAAVYPKEIIKRALELNATAMILSHNHPSGTLSSSVADDLITKKICAAANTLELRVLDHIIVSPAGTMSYAERGKMPF